MMAGRWLFPGLWLMRHLRLAGKCLLLAAVSMVLPVSALVHYLLAPPAGAGAGTLAWLGGVSLLVLAYLLIAFYRSFSQDLGQVLQAMDKVVQGDLRVALGNRGQDELGRRACLRPA